MKYYDGPDHEETHREERLSALTHGLGAAAAVAALVWMVLRGAHVGGAREMITVGIFGVTLVAVYVSSMLYHSLHQSARRRTFLICDHASIYLLIAGTYTPFMLVTVGGAWGWSIFGVIWGLALIGVVLTLWFTERFHLVTTGLYVAMGWVVLVCGWQVVQATSSPGLAFLVAGGLAYTAGVAFYLWHHLPFNHAIWHLFVLAGSVCHVAAAYFDVLSA